MTLAESEELLIEKAREEERKFNWIEAISLYQKALNYYLDENLAEKAAFCYKDIGNAYNQGANTVETAEDFVERIKDAIRAYDKAKDLFKQLENKSNDLECRAEIFLLRGILGSSDQETQEAFREAYKLFIEASKIYSVENEQESLARTLYSASSTIYSLSMYDIDREEYKQLNQQSREYARKALQISREIGNIKLYALSFNSEVLSSYGEMLTENFKENDYWREYTQNYLLKCEESIEFVKEYDDPYSLCQVYTAAGCWFCGYGYQFIENETEQEVFLDKGLDLLEESLIFARKTKDKNSIVGTTFFIDYFAMFSGRINYLQKRILNDINESLEFGKIYDLVNHPLRAMGYVVPALYYTNSSQRNFFTTAQRRIYAEKGIKYTKQAMRGTIPSPMIAAWLYQGIVLAYSQLTLLAESRTKQEEYGQIMLDKAEEAEKFGLQYEGGFPQAGGYTSLYKAHKTLADIAKKKEERISHLKKAINAQKKSINYAMLSRTGALTEQMRLGLLYEELGIITRETSDLDQAREMFLHTIKGSVDRRYYSYEAASYQYIARIEDRLGNYMLSAENYKKAQEAYTKSLQMIKYKLLKNRITEKSNYVRAWSFIEQAKSYHTRENHKQSQEFYKKAHDILKDLRSYGYEASYYSGWISLEEAEQLSKQERHEEAIGAFKRTGNIFGEAIKTLTKSHERSREKFDKERIDKFEKIAQVRVNHCNARVNLEEARILGKQGEHIAAAEKFALASSQFRDICIIFKIKREREELEAVYYLCRAWENMELAEEYGDPRRFSEASGLFAEASDLFTDKKLKLLASGNSTFCQALEYGSKFDE
ncbi:MAG: hypothetical protein ACW972_04075, partial [Promethearchaeota archaeon]